MKPEHIKLLEEYIKLPLVIKEEEDIEKHYELRKRLRLFLSKEDVRTYVKKRDRNE